MIQEEDPLSRLQRSQLILGGNSPTIPTLVLRAQQSSLASNVAGCTLHQAAWGPWPGCLGVQQEPLPARLVAKDGEMHGLYFVRYAAEQLHCSVEIATLPPTFTSGNTSHSGTSQRQIWHSELSRWKPYQSAYNKVQIRDSCAWVNQCLIS